MNFKTTAILLVLLIVVGAVWLFFPRGAREEEPEAPAPKTPAEAVNEKPLLDPQPEAKSIVRVTIERPGKPRLVFERPAAEQPSQVSTWRAVEPLAVPVLPLDRLVSDYVKMQSRAQLQPGAAGAPSAAEAGLAPPTATVTLADGAGKEYRFEVGGTAPMSDDTYVRLAGNPTIHVVTRDLSTDLKKEFNDYRDKRLVTLQANDAVRVEINTGGRQYVLTRGENAAWVIDAPVKAYAQAKEVLDLVRKLGNLTADSFVDQAGTSGPSFGLDTPLLTMSVTTETRRPLPASKDESETQPAEPKFETVTQTYTLQIGDVADLKKELRYARLADQPWVARVKQKDVDGLMPDLVKLRDPQITRVKAADATRLELTAGGETAKLLKVDGVWRGTGDLAELEVPAVTDLLQAFEDLAAIDYVLEPGDLATYGLAEPRAVVQVTAVGAVEPVTLRIGSETKSGRNAYVLREGQPSVFVVSANQASRLAVPPLALRSRSILTLDEATIRTLDVTRGQQHYALVREGGGWKMTAPAGAPVDPESIRTLVNDLSRLRAKQVVGKQDDPRFGLDKPAVTIRLTAGDAAADTQPSTAPATQPVEHVVRVGYQNSVAYARLDEGAYVFELDDTVYRVLSSELIQRKLFTFAPDEIVGVTVVGPGGTLELAKDGSEWKFVPDPFVKLAPKKVEDFVKDLAAMRVETYLEYQGADFEKAGLFAAPVTVSIRLRSGELANLKLEQERAGALPRLAGWVEQKRTFMLRQADCEKLLRGLDAYLQTEAKPGQPGEPDDAAPAGQPPRPPRPPRPAKPPQP